MALRSNDKSLGRSLGKSLGRSWVPGFLRPQWGVRGSLFAAFAVIAGMAIVISAGAGMVLRHLGGTMVDLSGRDIPRLAAGLQLAAQSASLAGQAPALLASQSEEVLNERAKKMKETQEVTLEKLGEMFHTSPKVLVELNSPETQLRPGVRIVVPNTLPRSRAYAGDLKPDWRATLTMLNVDAEQPQAARVVVDKSDGVLRVFDKSERLVAQFSATMGSEHDPLPIGTWKIYGADTNPRFHYNPKLFWDAKKNDDPEMLPPGPNGPVGVAWIDIDKPHYGIHGTPNPETIGRAESHGCVRLTNWDVARLAQMVSPGTPVLFEA